MSGASDSLEFNEADHTYQLNGRPVPGVTTVLEPYSGIEIARRRLGDEYMRRAAEFGHHVHLACDLLNNDQLDWDTLDEPLVPYVRGWEKFLDDSGFIVMDSEARVFSKLLRYAGTLDLAGIFPNTPGRHDDWALLDLKSTTGIPKTVGAQTAAYQKAYEEQNPGRKIRKRYCLQLKPDGTYKLQPLTGANDFALFQSCLTLYRAGWTMSGQSA